MITSLNSPGASSARSCFGGGYVPAEEDFLPGPGGANNNHFGIDRVLKMCDYVNKAGEDISGDRPQNKGHDWQQRNVSGTGGHAHESRQKVAHIETAGNGHATQPSSGSVRVGVSHFRGMT